MANAEHVKIFKEGIPIWNKWRRKHPEIIPDLSWSDLRWSDLRGSNLRGSNLSGSNLIWSNLSGTSVIDVITLLPFTIVVMTDKRVRIGCGAPKTIKACLKYTEDEAFAKGLPRERYQLYRAILRGLLK